MPWWGNAANRVLNHYIDWFARCGHRGLGALLSRRLSDGVRSTRDPVWRHIVPSSGVRLHYLGSSIISKTSKLEETMQVEVSTSASSSERSFAGSEACLNLT